MWLLTSLDRRPVRLEPSGIALARKEALAQFSDRDGSVY